MLAVAPTIPARSGSSAIRNLGGGHFRREPRVHCGVGLWRCAHPESCEQEKDRIAERGASAGARRHGHTPAAWVGDGGSDWWRCTRPGGPSRGWDPALREISLWSIEFAGFLAAIRAIETVCISTQRAFERYGAAVRISIAGRLAGLAAATDAIEDQVRLVQEERRVLCETTSEL